MIRKSIIYFSFLALSLVLYSNRESSPQQGCEANEAMHVFLLIGQSNMAGRAPITEEESGTIEHCFLLNGNDEWEPAKNPLNRYSSIRKEIGMQKLNPGYGFVKTMLDEEKGISIGLVVNAKGGTAIEEWEKGTYFYQEALRRAEIAQQSGILKGILWHQGESNHKDPEGYIEKLSALIRDMRKDLGIEDLPFVVGQINDVPAFNDRLVRLPQSVEWTGCASSDGLKVMDKWHFGRESMLLLGQRFGEEMIRLQNDQDSRLNSTNERK